MTALALTVSISWHDVWTVSKYLLAAAGGGFVVFLWMAWAAQAAIGRIMW